MKCDLVRRNSQGAATKQAQHFLRCHYPVQGGPKLMNAAIAEPVSPPSTEPMALKLVSVKAYLAGEQASPFKRGLPADSFARWRAAGIGTRLSGRILSVFCTRATAARRSTRIQKVRVWLPSETRFYYPDGRVVCERNPADEVRRPIAPRHGAPRFSLARNSFFRRRKSWRGNPFI